MSEKFNQEVFEKVWRNFYLETLETSSEDKFLLLVTMMGRVITEIESYRILCVVLAVALRILSESASLDRNDNELLHNFSDIFEKAVNQLETKKS